MPHTITCPTTDCGRQLRVPDSLVGTKVKCPSCGTIFVAHIDSEPPPPAPEPREYAEVEDRDEDRRSVRRPSQAEYDDEDDRDDRPRRRRRRRRYQKEHRGQLILVLGILSLVIAPLILGPIAWILGNQDMQEIRAGRMDPEGEGSTNAGRICGMIATLISGIALGCILLMVCMGFLGALSNAK